MTKTEDLADSYLRSLLEWIDPVERVDFVPSEIDRLVEIIEQAVAEQKEKDAKIADDGFCDADRVVGDICYCAKEIAKTIRER